MDSILNSVKKGLGIPMSQCHFDPDLVMHINTVFSILTQMGIGPEEGFSIEDSTMTWVEFVPPLQVECVKSYMILKVRLLFDPPTSATFVEVINTQIKELEVRMHMMMGGY